MQLPNFEDAVRNIVEADERYKADAYLFVQEAINYTQKTLGRKHGPHKHVAGKELLLGIRDYALSQFGPMTSTVFAEWGIHSCEDFGEIVFNLIEHRQATQSETDKREDFKDGYDFDEAFCKPFRPSRTVAPQRHAPQPKAIGKE